MRESTESSRRCNKSGQIKMQQESSDASRVVKSNESSRRVASPPATPSVWISLELSSDDPSTPPQDRIQSIKPTLAFETGDPSQNFGQSRQMRQESSNRMQLESSNRMGHQEDATRVAVSIHYFRKTRASTPSIWIYLWFDG